MGIMDEPIAYRDAKPIEGRPVCAWMVYVLKRDGTVRHRRVVLTSTSMGIQEVADMLARTHRRFELHPVQAADVEIVSLECAYHPDGRRLRHDETAPEKRTLACGTLVHTRQ